MLILNFKKIEESGRYVAAFTPTSGGALMVNQAKGGDLFVYIYTEGTEKILVDQDVTRRTDYIKMLDFTDVNIWIESTTPIKNAGYSGDGTAINIPTGKGEFGLLWNKMYQVGEIVEYEILEDAFNIGDKITGKIKFVDSDIESLELNMPLITEEQYGKFTKITVCEDGYEEYVITPEGEDWQSLFMNVSEIIPDVDFGKYGYMFILTTCIDILRGVEFVITYDGKDYKYTKDDVDIDGIELMFGEY